MINKDRIVPVTATDLISLYSLIVGSYGSPVEKLDPVDVNGTFEVSESNKTYMASQPVKKLNVAAGVQAIVYCVIDYGFEGAFVDGAKMTIDHDPDADGCTLYDLELDDTDCLVTKHGF